MKRKKTKFEKLFSLSRHRRRQGASMILPVMHNKDLELLRNTVIQDEHAYTHGSDNDLHQHISHLRKEFSGQSELCYYHATLIVLIRREIDIKKNTELFLSLWTRYQSYLLSALNTRWLVSAADTFADHTQDPVERACALTISALVNTVKLCETERVVLGGQGINEDNIRKSNFHDARTALWDGTSAFAIGTDDTLRNFRWRLESFFKGQEKDLVVPKILKVIFLRLQDHDTVYQRFKACHTRDRTRWW